MSIVESKIQTVEDMYRLIWTAIANRQPIRAIYKDLPRLFCPHRLGRNRLGQLRVLCYQCGESESESGLGPSGSPENWRCVVFEKLRRVELVSGSWRSAPLLVSWKRIVTPRISLSVIRSRGTERRCRSDGGPGAF
jgi:hypothetical protein